MLSHPLMCSYLRDTTLELISKVAKRDYDDGEQEQSVVHEAVALEANAQAAKAIEPGKKAFHLPAVS